ncbi:MAG TPA: cytochrome c, partial [Cyclobacteriaceae bacterium]
LLASITKKRSRQWVIQFIKNSQFVITGKDEYAKALYSAYNHVMPSFGKFDSLEINNLLFYIESESKIPVDDSKLDLNILQNSNPDILNGRELFNQQCSNCHSIYYERYGPALGSITKRLNRKWLYSFIRNSQKVIKDGNPYAQYIFNSYDHRVMVSMEFLTDEQIKSILNYIEYASTVSDLTKTVYAKKIIPVPSIETEASGEKTPEWQLILFKILILLVLLTSIIVFGYIMLRIHAYLKREHKG